MAEGINEPTNEAPASAAKDGCQEGARDIFAEKQKMYLGAFETACNDGKDKKSTVTVALAVVVDKDFPDAPIVYSKGGEYELAKMLALLLRQVTHSIMAKITP